MRSAIGFIFLWAVMCTLNLLQTHAQRSASVWDGVYTQEQANRGESLYGQACASCHGQALDGSGANPPLSGDDFKGHWDGQTLDDLFEKIQTTMPGDRPGQLSKKQNADILAFVLSFNQFPNGPNELPAADGALQMIQFEAAKPK